MSVYPFSNFKVHVVGYGINVADVHKHAKERLAAETILTYQKNFMIPIDGDLTTAIHKANVEGWGLPPTFEKKELGEKLVFEGQTLTDIAGTTVSEGGAFYNLIQNLQEESDSIWVFNKEIGSVTSIEVEDLTDEDDKSLLSMLKSLDILHDDPNGNPKIIYSATLEYTCKVDKLREVLKNMKPSALQNRVIADLIEKVKDDVTPAWLRAPGTEQIPSSKLFKSPIFKSVSSLKKYTPFGALVESAAAVLNTEEAMYAEFFEPFPEMMTHMVARPITKLGQEALNNALKSVGATIDQATALKLKQSTMQGVFPCKFLEEPKQSSPLHDLLIEAKLAGLPSAFYPNPKLGSAAQFTVVKVNRYNVGEGGDYHYVSIIATSHDSLRTAISSQLIEIGKKIKGIMEKNGAEWNDDVETLLKFVHKKGDMTWDPGVPAPWPIYSGYVKASDLSLLQTEKNKFLRSLGVGVKRISTSHDLRYDGTPIGKIDVWHKRDPFVPYLAKNVNEPWNSMYEVTIKTKWESFRKYTRSQVARKLAKMRAYRKYKKAFDKRYIEQHMAGDTYAEKLKAAKVHGYGKKGYTDVFSQAPTVSIIHKHAQPGEYSAFAKLAAAAGVDTLAALDQGVSQFEVPKKPGGPSEHRLKKMVPGKEKKKRIREATIDGLVRLLQFYNKDYRQLWSRTKAYQTYVADSTVAAADGQKIPLPDDLIMLQQLAAELYAAGLHETPVQPHVQRGKKGRLLILVRIPANIFDAYPIAMEEFSFDPPHNPFKRPPLIPEPLYGGPHAVTDLDVKYTFAENYKWFEKNIIGHNKTAETKFDKDKQIEVDSVLDGILKYYDKKHWRSGKKVLFPDYNAGPLSFRRESNNLNKWKYAFRQFLDKNDFDFRDPPCAPDKTPKPKGSEGIPSPKNPTAEVMLEFGFNKKYQLLYVLFNGQPLKTGIAYFREKSGMNNPRTNALIWAAPTFIKKHAEPWTNKSKKRIPWTEWILTYIYPHGKAIIRPSKKDLSTKNPPKLKKKPLSDLEVKRQMELLSNMKERARLLKETKNKKFTVLDDVVKNIDKISDKITDLESAYKEILNRYGLDQLAETLAQCLLESAGDAEDLTINLILKQVLDPLKNQKENFNESLKTVTDILNELPFECMVNVLRDTCSLEYGKETDIPPQMLPGLVNADEKYKKQAKLKASLKKDDPAFPPNADAKEIILIRAETAYKGSFTGDGPPWNMNDYKITHKDKTQGALPWPDDWKNDPALVKQWQNYLREDWMEFQIHLNPDAAGTYWIKPDGENEFFVDETTASIAFITAMNTLGLMSVDDGGKSKWDKIVVDGIFGAATETLTRWHGDDGTGLSLEAPPGAPWVTKAVFDKMIKGVKDWRAGLEKKKEEDFENKVVVKYGDNNSYVKKIQEFLMLTNPMLMTGKATNPVYIAVDKNPDAKMTEIEPLSGVYKHKNGKWYIDYHLKSGKGKGPDDDGDPTWKKKQKRFKVDGKYGPTTWQAIVNYTITLHDLITAVNADPNDEAISYEAPDLYEILTEHAKGKTISSLEDYYENLWNPGGPQFTYKVWKGLAAHVDKVKELAGAGSIDDKTGLKRPQHVLLYSPTPPQGYYCKPGTPGPCDEIYEKIIKATSIYGLVSTGITIMPDPTTTDPVDLMRDPKELKDLIEKLEVDWQKCSASLSSGRALGDGEKILWTGSAEDVDAALDEMAKKKVRVTEVYGDMHAKERNKIDARIEKLRKNGVKGTPKKHEEVETCRKFRQALINALNDSYGQDALDKPQDKTPEYFWPGSNADGTNLTSHEKSLPDVDAQTLLTKRTLAMTDYISCINSATVEARSKLTDRLPTQTGTTSEVMPFPKDIRQMAMQLAVHKRFPSNVKFGGMGSLWSSCKKNCQDDALKLINFIVEKLGVPPEVQAILGTLAGAAAISAGLIDPDKLPNLPKISIPKGTFKLEPFDPDEGFDKVMKQQALKFLNEAVKETVKQLIISIKAACEENKEELEEVGSSSIEDAINPPFNPVDAGTVQDRLNDLQNMFNDWGLPFQVGNLPLSPDIDISDPISSDELLDGITSMITPSQLCACFDGTPSFVVVSAIREYFEEFYPIISTAFITDDDIIEFFRQIGEIVDPSYCDGIEDGELISIVVSDDECLPDLVIKNRKKQLEDSGLEPEEIAEQLAKDQSENVDAIKEALDMINDDYFTPSADTEKQKCKEFAEMTNDLSSVNKMLKDVLEMTFDPIDMTYQKDIKFFVPSLILGKNVETEVTAIPESVILDAISSDEPTEDQITTATEDLKKAAFNSVKDAHSKKSGNAMNTESSKIGAMLEMIPNPDYMNLVEGILNYDGGTTTIMAFKGLDDSLAAFLALFGKAGLKQYGEDGLDKLIEKADGKLTQKAVEQYIADNGNGKVTEQIPKNFQPDDKNFGSSQIGAPDLIVAKNLHNSLIKADRFSWEEDLDGERFNFSLGPGKEKITYLVHDLDVAVDNYNIEILNKSGQRFGHFEDMDTVYDWVAEYLKSNDLQDFTMESSQKSILRNYVEKAMNKFAGNPLKETSDIDILNSGNNEGDEVIRELYRNMNLSTIRRIMKEIASSPLFMKNTLQKLNLAPSLEASIDDCGIPLMQMGVEKVPNLLNVEEEIEEAIEDYKQRELDKCDSLPFDEDREPLEEIIAETALRMLCKTFIVETLLKTIFSLSQFSADDCLSDDFIIKFIVNRFVRSAKKHDVYEEILDVAQRMVVRTRHSLYYQEPKVTPPKLGSSRTRPKVKGGERLPNTKTRREALEHVLISQIEEVGAEFSGMLSSVIDVDKIDTLHKDGLIDQITISDPIDVVSYDLLKVLPATAGGGFQLHNKLYYKDSSLPSLRWNKEIVKRPPGMLEEEFENFELINGHPLVLNDLIKKDGGFILEKYIKIDDNMIFSKKYQITGEEHVAHGHTHVEGSFVNGDGPKARPAWDIFIDALPTYSGTPYVAPVEDEVDLNPDPHASDYQIEGGYGIERKTSLQNYCSISAWETYLRDILDHVKQEHLDAGAGKKKFTDEDFTWTGADNTALEDFFKEYGAQGPQTSDPEVITGYEDYQVIYALESGAGGGTYPLSGIAVDGGLAGLVSAGLQFSAHSEDLFEQKTNWKKEKPGDSEHIGFGVALIDLKPVVDFWVLFPWRMAQQDIGVYVAGEGYDQKEHWWGIVEIVQAIEMVLVNNTVPGDPVGPWYWQGMNGAMPTITQLKFVDKWINEDPKSADNGLKSDWNSFMKQYRDPALEEALHWPFYAMMRYKKANPPPEYYKEPMFMVLNEEKINVAASPSFVEHFNGAIGTLTPSDWALASGISSMLVKAVENGGFFKSYFQEISSNWEKEYEEAYEEANELYEQNEAATGSEKALLAAAEADAIKKQNMIDELEKILDDKAGHAFELLYSQPLKDLWTVHGFFKSPWKLGLRLTYVLPDGPSSGEAFNKTTDFNDDLRKLIDDVTTVSAAAVDTGANQYHFRPDMPGQPTLKETYEDPTIPAYGDQAPGLKTRYMFPIVEVEEPMSGKNPMNSTFNPDGAGNTPLAKEYNNILPALKEKLFKTPEYRMLFNHVIPVRRLLSLSTLYNVMSIKYDGPTKRLFGSTKNLLFKTMLVASGRNPEENKDKTRDTDSLLKETGLPEGEEDDFASMIWQLFIKTPPLIIKGVCEIADPNITIAKKIYQGMQLVVQAIPEKISDKKIQEMMDADLGDLNTELEKLKAQEDQSAAVKSDIEAQEEAIANVKETVTEEIAGINEKIKAAKDEAIKVVNDFPFAVLSLSLLPSILPFGAGFPPPPFGPGIGPPLTPFGVAYLSLGLHRDPPDDEGSDKAPEKTKEQMHNALCRERLAEAESLQVGKVTS